MSWDLTKIEKASDDKPSDAYSTEFKAPVLEWPCAVPDCKGHGTCLEPRLCIDHWDLYQCVPVDFDIDGFIDWVVTESKRKECEK